MRDARKPDRKEGNTSFSTGWGAIMGLVLLLAVAVLLAGCPKKPQVQTAAPEAEAPTVAEVPEPEPPEVVIIEEKEEIVVVEEEVALEDVFFDFDKSLIRPDAKQGLDENIRALAANPEARIVVEGHCDERGTNEYNLGLGERRANAVRDYLVAGGIDSGRITTISYGEERPFCLGHDETAWQCNRRGHFVVVE